MDRKTLKAVTYLSLIGCGNTVGLRRWCRMFWIVGLEEGQCAKGNCQ